MSVVFLIFVGLVIYWTVSERRATATSAATAIARATTPTTLTPRLVTFEKTAPTAGRQSIPVFWSDYLSDHDRETLLSTSVQRSYRAGEIIFHEGDDADAFCLLVSGRVGLLTDVGHGRHLLAGTLGPGRLFAWSGLVGDHHYTATAHAVLDCQVAVFPAEAVRRLCASDPSLGYHLMNEVAADIAQRLHEHDERLGSLVAG
jgi:CRP-like cAMP-binding protein